MREEYREFLVNEHFDEIKNSSNNIIFFGSVGSGKTTCINRICKCNLKTQMNGFSCTEKVQYYRGPDASFYIDFPGLNSVENTVKYLKIQKNTLSSIPVRMICLVIKLETRYDIILMGLCKMIKIFSENRANIVIIITFCENITINQETEISTIIKIKMKIKTSNIIFTSNKMSSETLLEKLNSIKSKMENIEKIKINDRYLLNTVGNDGDIFLIEDRDNFLEEFRKSLEKFKKELNKTSDNSLKISLYYSFFNFKEKLIERFFELIINRVTDIDTAIVEIITFNNEIFNDFYSFFLQVQSSIKAETSQHDKIEETYLYNLYDNKVKKIIDTFKVDHFNKQY